MKNKIVLTAFALMLSQGLFAEPTTPAPEDCPSLSAIKSAVVNEVVKSSRRGNWIVYTKNQFNTHDNWLFAVELQANANTEEEAIVKANTELKQFTTMMGPIDTKNNDNIWICMYFKDFSVVGYAITPDDFNPAEVNLKFKV